MRKIIFVLALGIFTLAGCTENQRAKKWGGTATINLPKGEKLVEATWKETSLWYLTKPMSPQDSAQTYIFREDSDFGIIQGTVKFVETK